MVKEVVLAVVCCESGVESSCFKSTLWSGCREISSETWYLAEAFQAGLRTPDRVVGKAVDLPRDGVSRTKDLICK